MAPVKTQSRSVLAVLAAKSVKINYSKRPLLVFIDLAFGRL